MQGFKVAWDPWVGTEIGLKFMSMQGPGGARFPFAMTGHLMVGEEYLSQLLLSMSMHPCNRVTLFCGDRRKGELIFLTIRVRRTSSISVNKTFKCTFVIIRFSSHLFAHKQYIFLMDLSTNSYSDHYQNECWLIWKIRWMLWHDWEILKFR